MFVNMPAPLHSPISLYIIMYWYPQTELNMITANTQARGPGVTSGIVSRGQPQPEASDLSCSGRCSIEEVGMVPSLWTFQVYKG